MRRSSLRLKTLLVGALAGASSLAAPAVIGFDVAGVEKGNVLAGRPTGDIGLYAKGSGVCFFRDRKGAACGYVVDTTATLLRVRLTHGTNKFARGEQLRATLVEKFSRPFDQLDRKTASVPQEYARMLLAGGGTANVGSSSFFNGFLNFQYAFSPRFSLSLKPVVIPYPELFGIGGLIGPVYHFGTAYNAFFVGIGFGFYSMKAKTAVNEETIGSLAVQLSLGYRFALSRSLSIGATGGLTYLNKTKGDLIDLNLSSALPMVELDLGLAF